jgi:polyhydroxyalkanoate synthesis repressor PhaR
VLDFLGQSPPPALAGAALDEVWQWARDHWRVEGFAGCAVRAAPQEVACQRTQRRPGPARGNCTMATTAAAKSRSKKTKTGETGGSEGGSAPKGARVIRKYPNRRLYDTVESRYVTLADIRRLVVERIDFVVLDRKSQQDITRSILLQVIAEQEGGGESLMSRDFLSQVIRSYGNGLHDFVGRYLDESIQLFAKEQRDLRDRFKNVVGIDPLETVTQVAQKNYQRWKSLQEEVFARIPRPFSRDDG